MVTDTALVAAHLAGDRDAFGVLWTRHRRYVACVVVHTQGGNPAEVEDRVQDVAERVVLGLARWQGRCSFRVWLHTVTVNTTRTHLRRRMVRHDPSPLEHVHEEELERVTAVVEAGHGAAEDRLALALVLGRLPAHLFVTFVLVFHDDLSYQEVAAWLGVSPGTVKSRIHRAREAAAEAARRIHLEGVA